MSAITGIPMDVKMPSNKTTLAILAIIFVIIVVGAFIGIQFITGLAGGILDIITKPFDIIKDSFKKLIPDFTKNIKNPFKKLF